MHHAYRSLLASHQLDLAGCLMHQKLIAGDNRRSGFSCRRRQRRGPWVVAHIEDGRCCQVPRADLGGSRLRGRGWDRRDEQLPWPTRQVWPEGDEPDVYAEPVGYGK